jgi:hypothetical protein
MMRIPFLILYSILGSSETKKEKKNEILRLPSFILLF